MSGPNRSPDQAGGADDGGAGRRNAPPGAQRPAERVMHDGQAGRSIFREHGSPDGPFINGLPDDRPFEHADAALGGADAVQKTTYGAPLGAEPTGRAEQTNPRMRKGEGTVTARVGAGGGLSPVSWFAIALAVLAAVLYAAGIFG